MTKSAASVPPIARFVTHKVFVDGFVTYTGREGRVGSLAAVLNRSRAPVFR